MYTSIHVYILMDTISQPILFKTKSYTVYQFLFNI